MFWLRAFFLFISMVAMGGVQLGKPFGNGMVLQRERPVPVWGTAAAGATVTVSFAGQTASATADGTGAWRLTLDALTASKEGRVLEVTDGASTIRLTDVLVGEVWLASGQSNMEFPITGSQPRWRDDLGPMMVQVIRRERVRYFSASGNTWEKFEPKTLAVGEKSALAVYYALELEQALDLPVGVMVAAVGGTLVEEWYAGGRRYEQLIKALGPFALRGVIWYQGEGNLANYTDADLRFGEKLRRLHGDWMNQFENRDLRFDYVQIAPHVSDYRANIVHLAPFLEGMGTFAENDARASMTVISDLGCHVEIHPRHKLVVAKRLALHALKRDYGYSDIVADSPKAVSAQAGSDGKVSIRFSNVKALTIYHDERTYDPNIEICDENGTWHPATIRNLPSRDWKNLGLIGGDELVVAADGVAKPTGVRHLYQEPYRGCLYNEVNLPAGPFCIMLNEDLRDEVLLCDWIESTGNQIIDTGIVPGPDTSLDVEFATFGFVREAILFGTSSFRQHEFLFSLRDEMGQESFCWFGDYKWMPFLANRHLRLTVEPADNALTLFDAETAERIQSITSTDFQCQCGGTLKIFGQSSGQYSGKYRIYSFKIVKNGKVVRDFVPAFLPSRQRYGLLDRVTGRFFDADGICGQVSAPPPTSNARGVVRFNVPAEMTYDLGAVVFSGGLVVEKSGMG